MTRLVAGLLAALALLLAGCSDAPQPNGDAATMPGPAPALAAPQNTTLAPAPMAPVTVVCDVERTQAGTSLGVGLFLDRALLDDPGCYLDDLFGDVLANASSVLVEIEWTPQPSMTGAQAWFEASDCPSTPLEPCPLPAGQATASPLRLTLEGIVFATHAQADLGLQVAAQGAVVQQPFTVHLTLFEQPLVPADYTALG